MMPAGPRPGDLGEVTIRGRDRPARKENQCSTGISNVLIGPCAAGTLAPRIGRRPADLGRSRGVRRGRAYHRPHRPDSLGHRPGRCIAHRSGRRHARCRPPRTARPARPLPVHSHHRPARSLWLLPAGGAQPTMTIYRDRIASDSSGGRRCVQQVHRREAATPGSSTPLIVLTPFSVTSGAPSA